MKYTYIFLTTIVMLLSCAATFLHAQQVSDSLLLYLPMNGNVLDSSGYNNNGINHGVVSDTDRFGIPNRAYRFNGVDSYIEIPASPSMNSIQTANVVSISAWINIYQWYNNVNVFSMFERYNPTTDAGWLFEANWAVGGILFLADENVSNLATCNHTWNFHEWHHVCLTYNQAGDTAHFYVDGVKLCSVPYDAAINVNDTTTSFVIGRSLSGPDEYSDGLMDDIKIYNRVLTSSEINSIFLSESKPPSTSDDIALYPNPSNGELNIHLSESLIHANPKIRITDLLGRSLQEQSLDASYAVLNVQKMSSGIYLYQILTTDGFVKSGKLVIE